MLLRVDPAASSVQWAPRGAASATVPFQYVQLVGGRVPERPDVGRRRHYEIQGSALAILAAIQLIARVMPSPTSPPALRLSARDQGEEAFTVGLAVHQVRHSEFSKALVECVQGHRRRRCGRTTGRPARTGAC